MGGKPVRFSDIRIVDLGSQRVKLCIVGRLGEPFTVALVTEDGGSRSVQVESDWWPGKPIWQGTLNKEPVSVQVRPILNGVELIHAGIVVPARVYTEREAELASLMPEKKSSDSAKVLRCPMPGLVREINVAVGQDVKAGEPLCTVEAMKMENILRAERDATVKTIKAKPGDSLAVDAVIMEFA
jgi:propionyl-CoA carboxylase alpha chain